MSRSQTKQVARGVTGFNAQSLAVVVSKLLKSTPTAPAPGVYCINIRVIRCARACVRERLSPCCFKMRDAHTSTVRRMYFLRRRHPVIGVSVRNMQPCFSICNCPCHLEYYKLWHFWNHRYLHYIMILQVVLSLHAHFTLHTRVITAPVFSLMQLQYHRVRSKGVKKSEIPW